MLPEAQRVQGSGDILAVLPAAGIGAVGRCDEEEGVFTPSARMTSMVSWTRMPVAVPEVDRQLDIIVGQLAFERGDQRPVLSVDRTDAAEMRVVLGDFFEPFSGNIAAAVTFSRNGMTSSMPSGPPNERTSSASYAREALSKSGAPDRWAPKIIIGVSTLTHVADSKSGKFLVDRHQRAVVAIAFASRGRRFEELAHHRGDGNGSRVLGSGGTRYAEILSVQIDTESWFELMSHHGWTFNSSTRLAASPPESTSTIFSGSTPAFAPSTSASLTAA